jgi:hypothetical protein
MHIFSTCTKGISPQKKTGQNYRSKDLKEEKPGKTSRGREGGREDDEERKCNSLTH